MEQEQVEESTGETQEPEMVSVEEATDEDLDSFLETATKAEAEEDSEPEEIQEEISEPDETLETAPDEEVQEESQEPEPEQEAKPEQVTRSEFERIQKQLDGLELVTKRQTSRIGELKQELREKIKQRSQGLEERMSVDPVQATDDILEIKEAKKELERLDGDEQRLQVYSANQRAVLQHVNLEETPVQEIAKAFLSDGVSEEVVRGFISNPWAVPATTTIQAAKRVKAEGYLRKLLPEFKKLREENAKLRGRGGDEVLRKIDQAARRTPEVSASSGGAIRKEVSVNPNKPVHQMTDAELDALIAKG